jgi:two-component system, NtrC family, sensor kinase
MAKKQRRSPLFQMRVPQDLYDWFRNYSKQTGTPMSAILIDYLEELRTESDSLQRTQMEASLRESEARNRAIVEAAIDGFITISEQGHIESFNPAAEQIFGYTACEVMGQNITVLMPEPYHSEHDNYLANYLKTGERKIIGIGRELVGRRKDGTTFPMRLAVSEVRLGDRRMFIGLTRDITEQKQAMEREKNQQRQLLQADKMASLGVLVSGVAHEIHNPNYYITLNARLIERAWNHIMPILHEYYEENGEFVIAGMPYTQASEKIPPLIRGISDGAKRIQKIVQSLKNFARQDTGDFNQQVDVNSVVESATVILNNLIKNSTHHFSVEFSRNLPTIRGNSQQLEQVLVNLITNSCQALKDKDGGIVVSTSHDRDSNRLIITVVDEGEGIVPQHLSRITEPFFTTKQDRGGTGLGLSVSYGIIQAHGGTLNFVSDVGKGTTATIILPIK